MTPLNCILANSRIVRQRIKQLIDVAEEVAGDKESVESRGHQQTIQLLNAIEFSGQIMQLYNKNQIQRMKIRKGDFESAQTTIQNPEECIRQTIAPFSPQIKSKQLNVQILRRNYFSLEQLKGEWKYFQLAIFNLIQNSVKYNSYKGDFVIILGLEEDKQLDLSTYTLDIDIIDTGLGIEKERQKYLFIPFLELKVKQDLKEVKDNSIGLGLSCARDIMSSIKGSLTLKQS